ncbi:MAG: hypothetical protein ACTSYD_05800 [Candidatus Heimdallarchaeaceae archaeon]
MVKGNNGQWEEEENNQRITSRERIEAIYMVHPGRPILVTVSRQKKTEVETAITMFKELLAFFRKEHWKIKRIIVLADGKQILSIVTVFYNFYNRRILIMSLELILLKGNLNRLKCSELVKTLILALSPSL